MEKKKFLTKRNKKRKLILFAKKKNLLLEIIVFFFFGKKIPLKSINFVVYSSVFRFVYLFFNFSPVHFF